ILRRTESRSSEQSFSVGDVELRRDSREVKVAGEPVDLTAKEFDLLAWLVEHNGIVFSREQLLDRVWGMAYHGGTRTVDVHVAQLRRKRGQGTETVDGTRYFYAARFVHPKALVLVRPTRLGATASRPFVENLILAALVGVVLAAIAAYLLARAISGPVDRVAKASRRAAESLAPEPVPVEGAHELALLAESFNEMARQLTKARAAERQFLLSVSHELKTPLTAIRGYAEGLADGAFDIQEAAETIALEAG